MSGTRCADCGLVNWDSATECRRCSHDLLSPSSRLNSSGKLQYGVYPDVSQDSSRFTTGWVAASICSCFCGCVGFGLYAALIGARVGGDGGSVAGAIVASILGALVPLLTAHLIINDILRREQRTRRTPGKAAPVVTYLGVKPIELPPVLMVLRGVVVITVAIIAVAYSGEIIAKVLPSGRYPVFVLAFPAILAGLAALVMVDTVIAVLRK